jgi:hypothetical protein
MAYCCGGLLAGGGLPLAGGLAGGAALLSEGAGAAPFAPAAELSDGAAGGVVAGAAGWLLCVAAGGAAVGSVLEESFFAHAVSSSAAASALRATLVFIDRYPDALLRREPLRGKLLNDIFIVPRVLHGSRGRDFIESPCDWKQSEALPSPGNDKMGRFRPRGAAQEP